MNSVTEQIGVCKAQELVFETMRHAGFGAEVESLCANRRLWRGAIFGRFETATPFTMQPGETWTPPCDYGIMLRDISRNIYNAGTLLLIAPVGAEDALEALARTWHADEVAWENIPHAGKALRVWWD